MQSLQQKEWIEQQSREKEERITQNNINEQ